MIRYGIKDIEAVERIFKDPEIYERISDDGSPDLVDFDIKPALEHELFYFLSPHPDMVFQYSPLNAIMFEVHANVLKESRNLALPKAIETVEYMFENTDCEKIVAYTPDKFKDVLAFCLKVGFLKEGFLTKAYLKNGEIYDINVMGLRKGELCQQQSG